MSAGSGLSTKGEKNKKFSAININNFYQGVSIKSPKSNVIRQVGLQPLGKVVTARRLPAQLSNNLPEQSDSKPKKDEKTKDSSSSSTKQIDPKQRSQNVETKPKQDDNKKQNGKNVTSEIERKSVEHENVDLTKSNPNTDKTVAPTASSSTTNPESTANNNNNNNNLASVNNLNRNNYFQNQNLQQIAPIGANRERERNSESSYNSGVTSRKNNNNNGSAASASAPAATPRFTGLSKPIGDCELRPSRAPLLSHQSASLSKDNVIVNQLSQKFVAASSDVLIDDLLGPPEPVGPSSKLNFVNSSVSNFTAPNHRTNRGSRPGLPGKFFGEKLPVSRGASPGSVNRNEKINNPDSSTGGALARLGVKPKLPSTVPIKTDKSKWALGKVSIDYDEKLQFSDDEDTINDQQHNKQATTSRDGDSLKENNHSFSSTTACEDAKISVDNKLTNNKKKEVTVDHVDFETSDTPRGRYVSQKLRQSADQQNQLRLNNEKNENREVLLEPRNVIEKSHEVQVQTITSQVHERDIGSTQAKPLTESSSKPPQQSIVEKLQSEVSTATNYHQQQSQGHSAITQPQQPRQQAKTTEKNEPHPMNTKLQQFQNVDVSNSHHSTIVNFQQPHQQDFKPSQNFQVQAPAPRSYSVAFDHNHSPPKTIQPTFRDISGPGPASYPSSRSPPQQYERNHPNNNYNKIPNQAQKQQSILNSVPLRTTASTFSDFSTKQHPAQSSPGLPINSVKTPNQNSILSQAVQNYHKSTQSSTQVAPIKASNSHFQGHSSQPTQQLTQTQLQLIGHSLENKNNHNHNSTVEQKAATSLELAPLTPVNQFPAVSHLPTQFSAGHQFISAATSAIAATVGKNKYLDQSSCVKQDQIDISGNNNLGQPTPQQALVNIDSSKNPSNNQVRHQQEFKVNDQASLNEQGQVSICEDREAQNSRYRDLRNHREIDRERDFQSDRPNQRDLDKTWQSDRREQSYCQLEFKTQTNSNLGQNQIQRQPSNPRSYRDIRGNRDIRDNREYRDYRDHQSSKFNEGPCLDNINYNNNNQRFSQYQPANFIDHRGHQQFRDDRRDFRGHPSRLNQSGGKPNSIINHHHGSSSNSAPTEKSNSQSWRQPSNSTESTSESQSSSLSSFGTNQGKTQHTQTAQDSQVPLKKSHSNLSSNSVSKPPTVSSAATGGDNSISTRFSSLPPPQLEQLNTNKSSINVNNLTDQVKERYSKSDAFNSLNNKSFGEGINGRIIAPPNSNLNNHRYSSTNFGQKYYQDREHRDHHNPYSHQHNNSNHVNQQSNNNSNNNNNVNNNRPVISRIFYRSDRMH